MRLSEKRLQQSLKALKTSATKNKEDVQTWLSAALTFQEACKDSVPNGVVSEVSKKMVHLSELSSNALALTNRITGKTTSFETIARRLSDEGGRDGGDFPKWVSPKDRKLLQATTINADVVVAQDGSGNYKTVSEAIQAAPSGGRRFVIYVKKGVYNEKIRTHKDGITLIGDGKYSTIIVGDDSVAGGVSMPQTATFSKYL